MKLEPVTIRLKNGESVIIREACLEDAEEMIAVIKEYVEESEFIPYTKGEFNPTLIEEENWIRSFLNAENSILLVAVCNGAIVGNISVNGSPRIMLKHTAGIGLGLLDKWRGVGIGSALFNLVIQWAKNNPILELLWLETYSTNKQGLALYRKFGFEETGRQSDFVKISPSRYVDNVMMSLNVKLEKNI